MVGGVVVLVILMKKWYKNFLILFSCYNIYKCPKILYWNL
jgi:hypothetical protein